MKIASHNYEFDLNGRLEKLFRKDAHPSINYSCIITRSAQSKQFLGCYELLEEFEILLHS